MRFVLANHALCGAGGTEVHLVTLGEQLQRLGHEVVLYANEVGPFAAHAARRGLEVFDALRELPERCDVAFTQDGVVAHELASRYPDAVSVFRLCSDVYDFELPPQLAGVVDLIVVLSDRYQRLAAACASDVPVVRLRVPVDLDRIAPPGPIGERPQRAVLLGNYAERQALVSAVWGGLGIDVRRVGGSSQSYDVTAALADADVVVAKARAALDAMACGRAVYVYDTFGGDGWVTPENYAALEADNFAGQAFDRVIDAGALASDLAGYRGDMGMLNRDLVLQHHSARDHAVALLHAIGDRVPGERRDLPLRELARLIALQWSWEQTARELRTMHWSMRERAIEGQRLAADGAASERAAQERAHRAETVAADAVRAGEAERAAANERERETRARLGEAEARIGEAEARLAAEQAAHARETAALRADLEAVRATRAWRAAAAWWRLKRRLRGRS